MFASLKEKVGELLGQSKEKKGKAATRFAALDELIESLATHVTEDLGLVALVENIERV